MITGPATNTRARSIAPRDCSLRSVEAGGLIVAKAEHRGDAVHARRCAAGAAGCRACRTLDRVRRPTVVGDVAVRVDEAGHQRLALDVDARRAGRHRCRAAGPAAVIFAPSMTTVPFSMTRPVPSMTPAADKRRRLCGAGRRCAIATQGERSRMARDRAIRMARISLSDASRASAISATIGDNIDG